MSKVNDSNTARNAAATKIQALWRGYYLRKSTRIEFDDFDEIRKGIVAVDEEAEDEDSLYYLTSYGLDRLLNDKRLSHIQEACYNLHTATRLSETCCCRVALSDTVSVLLRLFNEAECTFDSRGVIESGVSVFLNLAKYDGSRCVISDTDGCMETLVKLLSKFRSGPNNVFVPTSLTLIAVCDEEPAKIRIMGNPKMKEELLVVYAALQMEENEFLGKDKRIALEAGSYYHCKLNVPQKPFWKRGPWRFIPDWDLSLDKPREILSKYEAISWLFYAYRDIIL